MAVFPEWRVTWSGETCARVSEREAREEPERCGCCGERFDSNGDCSAWRVVGGRFDGEARCDWCARETAE